MKRIGKYLVFLLVGLLTINIKVNAATDSLYVDLESLRYSVDDKEYIDITTYETYDEFIKIYQADKLPEIYITNFLYDGVSKVSSPDLDDFIDNGTNDTKISTLEIRVININTTGDVELAGETKGTMIAVNTNNVVGNINLILNNVKIDTDSKKAPAIFIYNKDTTYTDCKVTIETTKNSKNYIEGGKLKKVSLLPSDELGNYDSYYQNDGLNNYKKYTSYYGIYTSKEIDNILFATVKADSEDLQEGDPYLFYKGSGAISSDIDLYFEGEGYLKVTSKNKEGIETKGNLELTGGTGDYEISSLDDCLNTTTASNTGTNVRNNMIIDVNSLVAIVSDEDEEGDAIDSNGTLTIEGGTIYAFSHSNSQDSGLDSGNGIFINGGTIIATGNMIDSVSEKSKQNIIYVRFNSKIEKDTLIVIKDQNDNVITAFETKKDISTLLYSSDNLNYESFKIYRDGIIDGEETNGLYLMINSYSNGTQIQYNNVSVSSNHEMNNKSSNNNFILYLLLTEIGLLVIVLIYAFFDKQYRNDKKISM